MFPTGTLKSGRDNDDQLTYTCNVGLGLYDVAIAARVYQYAKKSEAKRS